MVQFGDLSNAMETGDHSKNGASLKSQMNKRNKTKMTTFLLSKLTIVFALFFICGCNKDDDNNKFDDSTPIEIEEIVYCQPNLSDTDLQAKYAIKTKNHSVITYEYAGVEMNATSCILYYDEIEKQGLYMIFSHNRMTQFIVSSQNKLDKFVCETEIIGSSIFIRGYEYDWDSGKITLLGEYSDVISSTSKQAQLRNANGNPDKVAADGVQNMLQQYKEALRKGGQGVSKTMGGVKGEFIESASNNTDKTLERAIKINNDTKILADDFWNKRIDIAITETWDNTKIWIVNNAEDFWDKIGPPIKNVGKAFYDHFAGGLKTAAENIKNFIKDPEEQGNLCPINGNWTGSQNGSVTTSAPGIPSQTTPINGEFGFVVENCVIKAGSYQIQGGSVSFSGNMTGNEVKIYLTATISGINQNWTYTGQLNAAKNKISGTWTQSSSYSGVTQSGSGTWEVTK